MSAALIQSSPELVPEKEAHRFVTHELGFAASQWKEHFFLKKKTIKSPEVLKEEKKNPIVYFSLITVNMCSIKQERY